MVTETQRGSLSNRKQTKSFDCLREQATRPSEINTQRITFLDNGLSLAKLAIDRKNSGIAPLNAL